MKSKTAVLNVATLVSMLALAAIPAAALTPPAMTMADDANNSMTIDSTGTITCVGACTTSASNAVAGSGVIVWSGTIGDFTVSNANFRTKPALIAPAMDIGLGSVSAGNIGGVLTVSVSDVDFAGSGPVTISTLTTLPIGGSVTYSSYVDGPDGLFGTSTLVGSYTSAGGNLTLMGAAGLLDSSFSMTEVEQITLAAGQVLISDDSLVAAPNPPLTLTCAVNTAQVGVAYSSSLTAAGGAGGNMFAIISGALPAGLTLNAATGLISGKPTSGGNVSFTAQVTDLSGHTAQSSCGINVISAQTIMTLVCPILTMATQGQPYSSSFTASGGKAPYQFSISGLSCNSGLSLNSSTGVLSGTPKTSGTITFSARVTDSSKPYMAASAACSLSISPPLTYPAVSHGDTATIGFWHNQNGQALILSLNGGSMSTSLANWLAATFPYLYGANSSYNLTGKTNTAVASLFLADFSVSGQKYKAQILAGALAVYVTQTSLGGTNAVAYKFNSSATGTGAKTFNVGSSGKSVGLNNNQTYSVLQLLQQANLTTQNGTFNASDFNTIFNGINQLGDIS
jgi:hypothetical protein